MWSFSTTSSQTKGRTHVRRSGVSRNSAPRTWSRPQCFGFASPSTNEHATDEPGWHTRNVPTADSRGLIWHSCSWPQITKSIHAGIIDSCTHVFRPLPTSRFWCNTKIEK